MEDIKVGDFVRTNTGIIGKIKRIELDKIDKSLKWYVFDKKRPDMNITDEVYINKPYIIKHSPNIIDLIEVGDYVNGIIVTQSYIDNIKHIAPEIKENNYGIKSIVTKEMFSSVEYRVENN